MKEIAEPVNQSPELQGKKKVTTHGIIDWVIRLVKGLLVGIGAIVPGLSGGVLAVVLGIYEPLLRFLADIRNRFIDNVRFFLPVGIGGVLGVFLFATVVDFAFTHYAAPVIWLFVGFIGGTYPSLLKTSGKQGRRPWHWLVLAVMAVGTFFFMHWMESARNVTIANPGTVIWLLSGLLVGLGLVVPGMSPSNFLIYLGLYQQMASGIRQLDFGVILPIVIGLVICIFAVARLVSWLFNRAYAFMYHFILGIVVGSTAAIIPSGVTGWTIALCALLCALGAAASFGLSKLDEKYPHESLF